METAPDLDHCFGIHHSTIQIETGERECRLAARDVIGRSSRVMPVSSCRSAPNCHRTRYRIVLVAGLMYLLSLALGLALRPVGVLI